MPSEQTLLWTSLTVLSTAIAVAVRWARYRLVAVNVAATALAVPLFLVYQHERLRVREQFDPPVWSQPHEVLGNVASPNVSLHWRKTVGFTPVFDIRVTTNAAGFRVTPPAPAAAASVVFMGCSYTFGHGVDDRETYPYLVGESLGPSVAAYNISFNGWGPQELLAALQSGIVEGLVKEPPKLVMFLAITDHVRRVIGRQVESNTDALRAFCSRTGSRSGEVASTTTRRDRAMRTATRDFGPTSHRATSRCMAR